MASLLIFSSEEALLAALTSDLLPAELKRQPVRYRRAGDGAIWVQPDPPISAKLVHRLRSAGVKTAHGIDPAELHEARFWPALIAPRRSAIESYADRTVLFVIDETLQRSMLAGRDRALLDLAAELLRLGCDRCAYQIVGDEPASDETSTAASEAGEPAPVSDASPAAIRLAFLRAFAPPYYTVAASTDRNAAYRTFVPASSGQTRTWIELGYSHPMAGAFDPPIGCVGLITGDGRWLDVPDGPWHDMFDFIAVELPAGSRNLVPARPERKLTVTLSLAPATRAEPPSLWLLGDPDSNDGIDRTSSTSSTSNPAGAIDRVDALIRTLPDDLIARLLFTVLHNPKGEPVVILRARHGRSGPPAIDIASMPMVPLMGIANLYVPHDTSIEPPLRRDTLRELLAPENDRLYWLVPLAAPLAGSGEQSRSLTSPRHRARPAIRPFQVHSVVDRAFSPLSDWVEYLVHRSARELEPWVRSVTFEFESFQSIGVEWTDDPGVPRDDRDDTRDRRRIPIRSQSSLAGDENLPNIRQRQDTPVPGEVDGLPAIVLTTPATEARNPSHSELALAELERAFLDLDAPADHPDRTGMWLAMARLLADLDRHHEAALCFVRAVWELPGEAAGHVTVEWWRAEARALRGFLGTDVELNRLAWLPLLAPDLAQSVPLRAISVHWIAVWLASADLAVPVLPDGSELEPSRAIHLIQQWLDANDAALDVRTTWLLRSALAARVGGDPLGLARVRDRILQSLRTGLSLERDVPTFLRFLHQGSGSGIGDSVAVAELAARLEALVPLFQETARERKATEASPIATGAYVNLVLAYGFARLGQGDRSQALRQAALDILDTGDSIHGFLAQAYTARIQQAMEGLPPETPLPVELSGMLNQLQRMDQYKVNRLREASVILESQERFNAINAFNTFERNKGDARGPEFALLRGMTRTSELAQEIDRLLTLAVQAETMLDDRYRLFDGIMDFLPLLPDARALPALRVIIDRSVSLPVDQRAFVLEEALMLAGYFGREVLADEIAQTLATLVHELPIAAVSSLSTEFARCLRSLRRVGLRERAARLIETLSTLMQAGDDLPSVVARVHLAAGLAYLGDFEQAMPILHNAHAVLDALPRDKVMDRIDLIRALAGAWSQCPQEHALAGLGQLAGQLRHITDSFSTNSHFCLSVVAFMEALVLGYARSDLALGEMGRRWLDEDEYLVRRRIHRDFGASS